jgi:hypothetical protein
LANCFWNCLCSFYCSCGSDIQKNQTGNDTYKNQIQTLDSVIKYQQKNIETLQRFNEGQDSAIQRLDEAYKKNRPTETRIIREYEKIPVTVRDLNREQLRNEVTNY